MTSARGLSGGRPEAHQGLSGPTVARCSTRGRWPFRIGPAGGGARPPRGQSPVAALRRPVRAPFRRPSSGPASGPSSWPWSESCVGGAKRTTRGLTPGTASLPPRPWRVGHGARRKLDRRTEVPRAEPIGRRLRLRPPEHRTPQDPVRPPRGKRRSAPSPRRARQGGTSRRPPARPAPAWARARTAVP